MVKCRVIRDFPDTTLKQTAWLRDGNDNGNGIIMGLVHRTKPIYSVQFHPESICSEYGQVIIDNFAKLAINYLKAVLQCINSRSTNIRGVYQFLTTLG